MWTVRLTVGIKLRFRIFPPKGGSCCNCKYSSTEDGKCFRNMFVKFQSRLFSDLKHLAFVIDIELAISRHLFQTPFTVEQ